jgi:hypothetical protein
LGLLGLVIGVVVRRDVPGLLVEDECGARSLRTVAALRSLLLIANGEDG